MKRFWSTIGCIALIITSLVYVSRGDMHQANFFLTIALFYFIIAKEGK